MIELQSTIPFIFLFSIFFLILRIFKLGIKISIILAGILTFVIPILIETQIPGLFDEIYNSIVGLGVAQTGILILILFFVGLVLGIKRKKVRKLSDIEILGKLEFKKADLVGKLSLARAKKDRKAEKAIEKELKKVEEEIARLKKKLGRHI